MRFLFSSFIGNLCLNVLCFLTDLSGDISLLGLLIGDPDGVFYILDLGLDGALLISKWWFIRYSPGLLTESD